MRSRIDCRRPMNDARRHELLRRHRRDTLQDLAMLDAGELWHALSEDEYRGVLIDTLEDVEAELGGEDLWREWE